ncbi:hypothetical protein LTR10_017761 [Elasticomyces elasticus]|nr:hypothetical protein LTR10_017761 [Elasticomyces elasticus]
MARSMRIDQLLRRPDATDTDGAVDDPSGWTSDNPVGRPLPHPELVVKTSSSIVRTASSAVDRFSWEFDKKELASVRRSRKRKSPINSHVKVTKRPVRLPRFSVNIFFAEPINNFPIPSEGCVPRMVKHYLEVWAPQHGRAFAFEGHPKPYQSLIFPYALERPILFETIVALSRASWLLQEGIPWSRDAALAYHRTNAFNALRLRLASAETCADDTTMTTIAALTTIDYILGFHEGAEKHVSAMKQIRSIRTDLTGETPWQYFLLSTMKAYEALWSFVKDRNDAATSMSQLTIDSPLRNELPVYPSLPFDTKVCEALSKVSSTFNDMALAGELSIQMIDILANLSTITKTGDSPTSNLISSPPSSPGARNLLNIIADLQCISFMGTTPIEHLLCCGLIGCCFRLHYGDEQIGEEYDEALQELEDTLGANGWPRSPQEQAKLQKKHLECLIWISVAGASALELSKSYPAASTVLDNTLKKYPKETSRWNTVEKILRKFLWNDFLAESWQKCWQRAMDRRSKAG